MPKKNKKQAPNLQSANTRIIRGWDTDTQIRVDSVAYATKLAEYRAGYAARGDVDFDGSVDTLISDAEKIAEFISGSDKHKAGTQTDLPDSPDKPVNPNDDSATTVKAGTFIPPSQIPPAGGVQTNPGSGGPTGTVTMNVQTETTGYEQRRAAQRIAQEEEAARRMTSS